MAEQEIGVIQHFFDRIGVAIISLTQGELSIGDTIHVKGHTTDASCKVETLQIEHLKIEKGEIGQAVGTKMPAKVRPQDKVFKITP